jgi:hypothetical protein
MDWYMEIYLQLGVHRIWNFQIRPEPDLPDLEKNSGRIWDKPVMGTIREKLG